MKPQLAPLSQWICDTCHAVIASPADGWLEWLVDERHRAHSFRICHKPSAMPDYPNNLKTRGATCQMPGYRFGADLDVRMTGPLGIVRLLAMIDMGRLHDPEGSMIHRVADMRGWADTVRRLFVPFYEEARLYFDAALADGRYPATNEIGAYAEEDMLDVIDEYGKDPLVRLLHKP